MFIDSLSKYDRADVMHCQCAATWATTDYAAAAVTVADGRLGLGVTVTVPCPRPGPAGCGRLWTVSALINA
jgi:hypothetical protein